MLISGKAYLVNNFYIKIPYNKALMKFLTSSKKEDVETHVRANHEKGIIIWSIGQLNKDTVVKVDLTFETSKDIKELLELGHMVMS